MHAICFTKFFCLKNLFNLFGEWKISVPNCKYNFLFCKDQFFADQSNLKYLILAKYFAKEETNLYQVLLSDILPAIIEFC